MTTAKNPTIHCDSTSARVILDSLSADGIRLTTMHLRYPRIIHSEFMTHRMFSRNGRSSRAVPVATLMAEARNDPFIPHFLKNQPGMQASEEFDPGTLQLVQELWTDFARKTTDFVQALQEIGVHKQWANRPLEWFGYIDVLVSSTAWNNWFALRDHDAAQPEIQSLAKAMKSAMLASAPNLLPVGNWHLPYVTQDDEAKVRDYLTSSGVPRRLPTNTQLQEALIRISVARCARLSYKPFDGNADVAAEFDRYDKLVGSAPVHASPAEHQATPDYIGKATKDWVHPDLHGNFTGWVQYRKLVLNEWVPG